MKRLSVVLVVALLLVACGGGGGATGTTADRSGASDRDAGDRSPGEPAGFYEWDGDSWMKRGGNVPDCPDPDEFFDEAPANLSKATAVLTPGQVRGGNYKPHGGFRFDESENDDVEVVAPADAELWRAARYIEAGEVQYMLDFRVPCGIMFRFDHLRELSPDMERAVSRLPKPAVDDFRTTNIVPAVPVSAGESIATSVGFESNKNVSFDFGVYDPRRQNEASKNPAFPEQQVKELSWYAVCWYDMFDDETDAIIAELPPGDEAAGAASDYCG